MKNVISQSLGLDLVNINVCAKVYQNISLSSRDRVIFTFSEFEPRQRLSQSQMIFVNLKGYILSIPICMQNFITIFHSVEEIKSFSLFQNLESAKPRPMKNDITLSLGQDLVNINVFTQRSIKIFHSVQEIRPFSLFQNMAVGKASNDDKCHFAIVSFFQNLKLGKNSTNLKYHLTVSWARSCQYQCLRKSLSKYSTQFKR